MQFMEKSKLNHGLLAAGILIIAFNLRPALASIGPLVGAIRDSTGLSNSLIGLLTTLPLLAFGVVSMFTSLFTRRWGIEITIAGALALLFIGLLVRVIPVSVALFGGTFLAGVGIAFGNVLVPSLIKRDFPEKSGQMTGFYTGILAVGTSIAAGISFPLAVHWNWRLALGVWAIAALLALVVWIPQLRHHTRPRHSRSFFEAMKHLGKTPLAWQVAFFMGLQSLAFYVILAWLPEMLRTSGMDASRAGLIFSLAEAMGILGSFLLPYLAEKLKRQYLLIWILAALDAISIIGLMLPAFPLMTPWALIIGFSLGGSFSLALLFIVLRTSDTETATELSGMVQSIGYLLAATGPAIFGLIHDLSHSWRLPLIILLVILFFKFMAGLGAVRPLTID